MRRGLGLAELTLEAAPCGLAVFVSGLAFVVWAAAALDVGVALALLDALACFNDRLQANLASLNLSRDVHLWLFGFGRVGGLRALQQRIDLGLQFGFGLLHALKAHRLVAAGVGLELGAVDGHSAQLDQTHLASELDHLHKQLAQLLEVQRAEVANGAVLGEVAGTKHPKRQVIVQPAFDLA